MLIVCNWVFSTESRFCLLNRLFGSFKGGFCLQNRPFGSSKGGFLFAESPLFVRSNGTSKRPKYGRGVTTSYSAF